MKKMRNGFSTQQSICVKSRPSDVLVPCVTKHPRSWAGTGWATFMVWGEVEISKTIPFVTLNLRGSPEFGGFKGLPLIWSWAHSRKSRGNVYLGTGHSEKRPHSPWATHAQVFSGLSSQSATSSKGRVWARAGKRSQKSLRVHFCGRMELPLPLLPPLKWTWRA